MCYHLVDSQGSNGALCRLVVFAIVQDQIRGDAKCSESMVAAARLV